MKRIGMIILTIFVLITPAQVFAVTQNHIPYITKSGIDQIQSTQVIVDNTAYDLKPGQYFTIRLENAEFDLDDDGEVRIRSNHFEFGGSSKKSIYGKLKDSVTEGSVVSFSFYSKILGGDAKVIIEPEDSGIGGGEYIYASTDKLPLSYKGTVENIAPMFLNNELLLPPIVIKENVEASFRTIQTNSMSNEPLITIMPESNQFKIRSVDGYHDITFVVDDGKGNSKRYEVGRNSEASFDYTTNKLTFKKADDDIFNALGDKYTIRIENMKVLPNKEEVDKQDIKLVFDGLLINKQTITLGSSLTEPLKLEASKEELQSGEKQKIRFSLIEQHSNTLFKEGYISLGLYGGATIDSKSDLKFTIRDGSNTYNELERKAFKIVFDPLGDRVTIENYRRKGISAMQLEGELLVTAPDRITQDIEFFINEPGLSKVVKQTVLTAPKEIIQLPLPVSPKVQFTINQDTYRVDGANHPIDAKPYISVHDRIMVPLRYVAYALGVDSEDLKWDGPSQTITLTGDRPMTIDVATGKMIVDGKTSILSETRLMGGRTFVPVGEIARAFGTDVQWDAESRTATFN